MSLFDIGKVNYPSIEHLYTSIRTSKMALEQVGLTRCQMFYSSSM